MKNILTKSRLNLNEYEFSNKTYDDFATHDLTCSDHI